MPYLTNQEYKELGFDNLDDTEFDKLIVKASSVLDYVTNNFYQFTDLNDDVEFRKNQFKKALGSQVEYFNNAGATTYQEINSAPHSFSAGRTSVSNANTQKTSGDVAEKGTIAEEVYMHLKNTGLTYSGLATI